MKIIFVDTARTNSSKDCEAKGIQARDKAITDGIDEVKKSGIAHIGAGHLWGISSLLSKSSTIYHCNINTCRPLPMQKESKAEQFSNDETKCFQAYLPESVTNSQEIMLLMKNLIAKDLQGKKLIPTLIENKIFQTTPLKIPHTPKSNPTMFGGRTVEETSTAFSKLEL